MISHIFVVEGHFFEMFDRVYILIVWTVIISSILFDNKGCIRFDGYENSKNAKKDDEQNYVGKDIVQQNAPRFHIEILPNDIRWLGYFADKLQVLIKYIYIFVGFILLNKTEIVHPAVPKLLSPLFAFLSLKLDECRYRPRKLFLLMHDIMQNLHFLILYLSDLALKHMASTLLKFLDDAVVVIREENAGNLNLVVIALSWF